MRSIHKFFQDLLSSGFNYTKINRFQHYLHLLNKKTEQCRLPPRAGRDGARGAAAVRGRWCTLVESKSTARIRDSLRVRNARRFGRRTTGDWKSTAAAARRSPAAASRRSSVPRPRKRATRVTTGYVRFREQGTRLGRDGSSPK